MDSDLEPFLCSLIGWSIGCLMFLGQGPSSWSCCHLRQLHRRNQDPEEAVAQRTLWLTVE